MGGVAGLPPRLGLYCGIRAGRGTRRSIKKHWPADRSVARLLATDIQKVCWRSAAAGGGGLLEAAADDGLGCGLLSGRAWGTGYGCRWRGCAGGGSGVADFEFLAGFGEVASGGRLAGA